MANEAATGGTEYRTEGSSDVPATLRRSIVLIGLGLIVGLYGLTAFLIPVAQETPIVDEPIFASSAFQFARSGQVEISNLSAPNGVFDAVWGGLFVQTFGETYGALRASTIVLTAASSVFMYWLCREVGGSVRVSLLGTAAYLFAPLAATLSFTYHTDPHALALIVVAAALFARAMRIESNALFIAASIVSSVGLLSRQQVVIVPIAALIAIWLRRWNEGRWRITALVAIAPLSAFALHALWTSAAGQPFIRHLSLQSAMSRGTTDIAVLSAQTLTMAPIYIGLFALPFLPLLVPCRQELGQPPRKTTVALGAGLLTLGAAILFQQRGPFHLQTWLARTGVGGVDRSHLGARPDQLNLPLWGVVTFFLLLTFLALFVRLRVPKDKPQRSLIMFLILSVCGFLAAAFASSLALQGLVFDRYLLPLLPFVIALAAAGLVDTTRRFLTATALTALLGLYSMVGVYDAFVAYREVTEMAKDVIASGVDPLEFDGGASWSAATFGLVDDEPVHVRSRRGPYWVKFYAVETDPKLGIALAPLEGYEVLDKREYTSLLHTADTFLYLIRPEPGFPYFQRVEDF